MLDFQKTIKGFFRVRRSRVFEGLTFPDFLAPESVVDDLRIFSKKPHFLKGGGQQSFLVGHPELINLRGLLEIGGFSAEWPFEPGQGGFWAHSKIPGGGPFLEGTLNFLGPT